MKGYTNSRTEVVPVLFHWSTKHGECVDCGNPAAFTSTRYVRPEHSHEAAAEAVGSAKLCAVCAANDAADGESIARLAEVIA